jgi:hypothetical protein
MFGQAETEDANGRYGRMRERQLNAFANAKPDDSIKLAIAQDLERLYSSLVAEPIPPNLRSYIDRLGQALGERKAPQ